MIYTYVRNLHNCQQSEAVESTVEYVSAQIRLITFVRKYALKPWRMRAFSHQSRTSEKQFNMD